MSRLPLAIAPLLLLLLAGCGSSAPAETVTETIIVTPTVDAVRGEDITSVADAVVWADGLDSLTNQGEVSRGLRAISDIVPDLGLRFDINNEIGIELISLNAEVLNSTTSADVVPKVKAVVARLAAEAGL